jgi:hypothetical protein
MKQVVELVNAVHCHLHQSDLQKPVADLGFISYSYSPVISAAIATVEHHAPPRLGQEIRGRLHDAPYLGLSSMGSAATPF